MVKSTAGKFENYQTPNVKTSTQKALESTLQGLVTIELPTAGQNIQQKPNFPFQAFRA